MNYSYRNEFQEALDRTKRLGFSTPSWNFNDGILYSQNTMRKVTDILNNFLWSNHMSYEDLSGQCIAVNIMLSEKVAEVINCNALITIGWVYDENINSSIFKFTEEDFKSWMSNSNQSLVFDVHVWTTLDSGEIIDFTLVTTIGEVTGHYGQNSPGCFLMAKPEEPELSTRYHPMVVGNEAVMRTLTLMS